MFPLSQYRLRNQLHSQKNWVSWQQHQLHLIEGPLSEGLFGQSQDM
jgi:hypothetical protein